MERLPLEKSPYSKHFNNLVYLGAWVIDTKNPQKLNAYVLYKTCMTVFAFSACVSLFIDFYCGMGDFKKMTWNLCITALFFGGLLKNIYTIHRSNIINRVRRKLHKDATKWHSPQDELMNEMGVREMKNIRLCFYIGVSVFVPFWLITLYLSFLWGPKKMPIPLVLPFKFDYENEFDYNFVFFMLSLGGCAGISLVMETELAMFTILIQISREYNRLLCHFKKIDELFEKTPGRGAVASNQEVNCYLRSIKAKKLVKGYCIQQQRLIEYTEDFELSYSFPMLLQVLVVTLLVIVSAVQCILEFGSISANVGYQIGYICVLFTDMFLVCWFATRIREQCLKVGEEAYAILWYQLDVDIQKDIFKIIMRSQRPPKLTAGKLMEMNLHAFMLMVRNIYSWLTLFNQLAFKSKE